MKKIILTITFSALLLIYSNSSFTQCAGWNNLQPTDSLFTNVAFGITTTIEADKLQRPIVYLANVSGGVSIYDNNALGNPLLLANVPKSLLGNSDAINLFQDSIWLYVCLGNLWDTTEMAGLAIIDVSDSVNPIVLDFYLYPGRTGGAGAVAIRGNQAYLAANRNGLVILDISDKSDIQLTSSLPFNNNFPHSTGIDSLKYNARGIALKDSFAYVCYDRGGLRVVNIADVNSPVQISEYCFSNLVNFATAYNNIVIDGNTAYVALDYYGMEILDISNPSNISQLGWWHPSSWPAATNNPFIWAGSEGHCNELAYDSLCKTIYVASGRSDVVAIDVSNPASPATCQTYGSTTDQYGTWGLDLFDSKVNIAYIYSPIAPPFSNYTGYKVLPTNCSFTSIPENDFFTNISIFPNPGSGKVYINTNGEKIQSVFVYNLKGKLLQQHFSSEFTTDPLPAGLYFVHIQTERGASVKKLIKE